MGHLTCACGQCVQNSFITLRKYHAINMILGAKCIHYLSDVRDVCGVLPYGLQNTYIFTWKIPGSKPVCAFLKVSYSDVGEVGVAENCEKIQFFLNTLYLIFWSEEHQYRGKADDMTRRPLNHWVLWLDCKCKRRTEDVRLELSYIYSFI